MSNDWNAARFDPDNHRGHYESWFARANHPDRPLAFWIRYTIFAPRDTRQPALGELWAIVFDGERDVVVARKLEQPLDKCRFDRISLNVRMNEAMLDGTHLRGRAHDIGWDLEYGAASSPLLLLPERLYAGGFPKAKAVVGAPLAAFKGRIMVGDRTIPIDKWIGSQNHNWGSQHTDHYAWGQVAGFDDAPDVFLECITGRVALGPVKSPWVTMVVLQLEDERISINDPFRAMRARAKFDYFEWEFDTHSRGVRIHGRISAPTHRFVGLRYLNPPGGEKICLNSKLARCVLTLDQPGRPSRRFSTAHRAAFEILTDDRERHGLPLAC